MNGDVALDVRAEQRAVSALILALLTLGVAAVHFGWWLFTDDWNFTVLIGCAVLGGIAVSIGDAVRDRAPSKGQAGTLFAVMALTVTVVHLLSLIGSAF